MLISEFQSRTRTLVRPGERLGVAVSGGADSVALFRLLAECKDELGIVLSVVHFNHKLRGADSDADEAFVHGLAEVHGVPIHLASGETRAYATEHKISIETAARELRYAFFAQSLNSGLDKIATAHTIDDQAETVLMRLLRGAGTRGLAGIYPVHSDLQIVRPLLEFCRADVEQYLRSLGQSWRADETNTDPQFTRNRIRHELLPMLARDYNPAIMEALARTADVARDEEAFWDAETKRLAPSVIREGKPVRGGGRTHPLVKEVGIDIDALLKQPVALQRRLIRVAALEAGVSLDIIHTEAALKVARGETKACELPGGWRLERSFGELRFTPPKGKRAGQ
jgi:tRNA(Ile)-lysidine synthase